jgi:hypothetical protein
MLSSEKAQLGPALRPGVEKLKIVEILAEYMLPLSKISFIGRVD